jgi:putative toxin-antitoxin system antitoxin component (TIGR02293 family)
MPGKILDRELCEHESIELKALILLGVKEIIKAMMAKQKLSASRANRHFLKDSAHMLSWKPSTNVCFEGGGLWPDQFIREGFDSRSSRFLKNSLGITDSEMSELIGVTSRTIQRKLKAKEKFDMIASDRLYRVALVFALATEVFEDEEEAREWLREPQYDLGNRVPLEVIQTEAGAREVESLLRRIDQGVLA